MSTDTPSRRLPIFAILLAANLGGIACDVPTAPDIGMTYGLVSVSGRRPPTWRAMAPPTDSMFPAVIYEEYRIISDTLIRHNLWLGFGNLHADSSVTYHTAGCWINFPVRYRQHQDTLFLTDISFTGGPSTPPFLLTRGRDLTLSAFASPDGNTYRYVPSRSVPAHC
jgi:hypothetical protein